MIFAREVVEGARDRELERPWSLIDGGDDWITDGTFAVRCPDFGASRVVNGDPLREVLTVARTVVVERRDWRIPFEPGDFVSCEECDGEGGWNCTCHCGDEHDLDCKRCGGRGSVGSVECERGQIVLDGWERPIVLAGRFAPFIDAAVRLEAAPGKKLPVVVALGTDGEPIAYLMPRDEEPRDPAILGETKEAQP